LQVEDLLHCSWSGFDNWHHSLWAPQAGVNCPEAAFVHLVHAAAAAATDFDKQRHPGSLTALFTNM
jgi:hypothetical protein